MFTSADSKCKKWKMQVKKTDGTLLDFNLDCLTSCDSIVLKFTGSELTKVSEKSKRIKKHEKNRVVVDLDDSDSSKDTIATETTLFEETYHDDNFCITFTPPLIVPPLPTKAQPLKSKPPTYSLKSGFIQSDRNKNHFLHFSSFEYITLLRRNTNNSSIKPFVNLKEFEEKFLAKLNSPSLPSSMAYKVLTNVLEPEKLRVKCKTCPDFELYFKYTDKKHIAYDKAICLHHSIELHKHDVTNT